MFPPVPLALASWSVSLDELAIWVGVPAFVCVSLFVVTIGAITRDHPKDRKGHG